jgi:hypothetical protein
MNRAQDKFDWKQFDPYQGTWPIEIPSIIDRLRSEDQQDRKNAHDTLIQWPFELLSQIGRLGAVPIVVDCLLEIAQSRPVTDRLTVLDIIVNLADAAPEYSQFTRWYKGTPSDMVAAVNESLQRGFVLFEECLGSDEPKIRAMSARALGLLGSLNSVRALLHQLRIEMDEQTLQAILDALSGLSAIKALPLIVDIPVANSSELSAHRASAICQISARLFFENLRTLASMAILGLDPDSQLDISQDLVEYAIAKIKLLGNDPLDWLVYWSLERVANDPESSVFESLRRLVMLTIPVTDDRGRSPKPSFRSYQMRVLRALAESDLFWSASGMALAENSGSLEHLRAHCLREIGVPESREELRKYLNELSENRCATTRSP